MNLCHSNNEGNTASCEFRRYLGAIGSEKTQVLGVSTAEVTLNVPNSKVNCSHLFGEYYVYLSCMGLCLEKNAICPLNNKPLLYSSCPGQFLDRVITLANNSFPTFVLKSAEGKYYHPKLYSCKNNRCINYSLVCNLIDDCGDMSDEEMCSNHVTCNDTKHLISLQQKCDGIYDCFDLNDECNFQCGKEIPEGWWLKGLCWLLRTFVMLDVAI